MDWTVTVALGTCCALKMDGTCNVSKGEFILLMVVLAPCSQNHVRSLEWVVGRIWTVHHDEIGMAIQGLGFVQSALKCVCRHSYGFVLDSVGKD